MRISPSIWCVSDCLSHKMPTTQSTANTTTAVCKCNPQPNQPREYEKRVPKPNACLWLIIRGTAVRHCCPSFNHIHIEINKDQTRLGLTTGRTHHLRPAAVTTCWHFDYNMVYPRIQFIFACFTCFAFDSSRLTHSPTHSTTFDLDAELCAIEELQHQQYFL